MREVGAGTSVEAVAKRHGVRPKTLLWWKWQLGRTGRAAAEPARWLPVVVRDAASTPRVDSLVVLAVAGCEVRITVGTDPSYIGELVRSLRAC